MLVLYLLYWFDIQSTKLQAYASCTQQYLCFSLAVVFNYRLSDVNSCNYTTTHFHALVLLWKCVLHWGGAEPLWGGCILPRIMSSQCSGIPWGFPSDLTSHPSSNSNSREEKGFVIWLPASFCFLRSEAELWFIVKFPQARSISRPTESLNGGNCSPREWPFLGWSLPRPEQGLIKVISFFFFFPCHVVHCFMFEACYTGSVRLLLCVSLWFGDNDKMMQNDFENVHAPNLSSQLTGIMPLAQLLSNFSCAPFVITFLSAKRCHV